MNRKNTHLIAHGLVSDSINYWSSMMSVNTLGEVPDANGYIIELGMEGTDHPAASLDENIIRNEMGQGEWYVRTADLAEEQELMVQIDNNVDHTRLPAYLILNTHPEEATDAITIYLNSVDTVEEALATLKTAVSALQDHSRDEGDINLPNIYDYFNRQTAWAAVNIGSRAIQYITFLS